MLNLEEYFENYQGLIFSDEALEKISEIAEKLTELRGLKRGKILIFGNGASASISSHFALDMTKQGKYPTLCFHDPALLTAYANDYGYENAFCEIFKSYAREGDWVFVVSTSGESENIVRLLNLAKGNGHYTVSFSGRHANNRARKVADLSFWVNSHAYNIVENTHSIWLTALVDSLVGTPIYEVSNKNI